MKSEPTMSDSPVATVETDEPVKSKKPKGIGGIKSATFTKSGTNGASHRKNKERKDAQHRRNVKTRGDIYRSKATTTPGNWHSLLDGLSKGTA